MDLIMNICDRVIVMNDVRDSMGAIGIWKIQDGNIVNKSVEV